MKIVDASALQVCRDRFRCEHCQRRGPVDAAHVYACGMGSGGRVDHRLNLVAACRLCHTASHAGGEPTRETLLAIVAKREGVTVAVIVAWIDLVRRLPKGSAIPEVGE